MAEPLAILVVGEDPLARSALLSLVARDPDVRASGELSSKDDVAREAARIGDGVVLLDLGLDARSGLDRLRELGPLALPVVVLLTSESHALEAFALGARGLVLRNGDPERLRSALRAVARGNVVLDEAIAERVLRPVPTSARSDEQLTKRELEVLELLAEGRSNRQIAEALKVTEHTAKFHVNAILTKLGAETRTEAVVLAAKLGLVVL